MNVRKVEGWCFSIGRLLIFVICKSAVMKIRLFYIVLFVLVLCLLALPVEAGLMLSCPLHELTGWQCPFCGGQRMAHALLHGRVEEAFWCNPLLFGVLPLAGWMLLGWLLSSMQMRCPRLFPSFLFSDKVLFFLLVVFFLWGIVRNVWDFV